jgi:5-methylthioadenosine/S-adenosylhomocysteine deaminase
MSGSLLIRNAACSRSTTPTAVAARRHRDRGRRDQGDRSRRGPRLARPAERVIEAEVCSRCPASDQRAFHSPGNLMKGRCPAALELFMLHEVPPLAPAGDGERLVYVRTMLGALEMLRRGITAVHDDAYHVPVATRESIDAIMRAYEDAGIRATVAIDQPNVVEYEKSPFLADLLPEERRAMDRAPRPVGRGAARDHDHLIDRWHGKADGRLGAAGVCSRRSA